MNALAEERGIAPSILRGRPWAPGEPLWTDDDLDEVLAYRREKAKVCGACGTREEDWRDEEGRELTPPPYIPELRRDFGCQALEQIRRTIPDGETGVYAMLVPNAERAVG